ncbi:hypothetical protein BH23GEM7_BH23GEM7_03130 [soil metagenome]|nr:glycosyltransferase family 2 protein [Gemmatimonadota bacterium]
MNINESRPLVSVGMPTYNRAVTLRRAIESVLAQDYPHFELVISDNASTDETQALCEEFCKRDSRIRYIRQPVNCGANANFRKVLDQSRGEFFMWLADDDWLDYSYVSACVEGLMQDPACALVSGRARYYRGSVLAFQERPVNLLSESPPARVRAYYRSVASNGIFYGVMRRRLLTRIPLPNIVGGDWLILAAIAFFGKIRTLNEIVVHRSLGGASNTPEALVASVSKVPQFYLQNLYLYIAVKAFEDISYHSQVYDSLSQRSRVLLAGEVFATIFVRYCIPVWLTRLREGLGLPPGFATWLRQLRARESDAL